MDNQSALHTLEFIVAAVWIEQELGTTENYINQLSQ